MAFLHKEMHLVIIRLSSTQIILPYLARLKKILQVIKEMELALEEANRADMLSILKLKVVTIQILKEANQLLVMLKPHK